MSSALTRNEWSTPEALAMPKEGFAKYPEDAVSLFIEIGISTIFIHLEGWPEDWKTNLPEVIKFFREHQCPSFLEYGEYPDVSADEVKKALELRGPFSGMRDLMH